MSEFLINNIIGALAVVGFFAVLFLTSYFVGNGLGLGWYRGKHKAEKERDEADEGVES